MTKRLKHTEADFPAPGAVFVARTTDGRIAAGRVLRRQIEGGAWAVLIQASRWIDAAAPALTANELREPLILTHHNWQSVPNVFWTHDVAPHAFQFIGCVPPSDTDLAVTSHRFGGWQSVPLHALTQWRWDHNREELLREEAEQAAAETERRRQAALAREAMQRNLTLESLAEKTWLESWDGDNPHVPKVQSQALLVRLVEDLRAQPKLTTPVVRQHLKQTVVAFNQLDAEKPFISTIEREDLEEAFEQIACAAGFPQLADEIDRWRKW